MFQVNNLHIMGHSIRLYLDENKTNKLQDLVDEMSVMCNLLGYRISVESKPHTTYDTIIFEREDNYLSINFQHVSQKTTCYCIHNGEHISINQIKKLI